VKGIQNTIGSILGLDDPTEDDEPAEMPDPEDDIRRRQNERDMLNRYGGTKGAEGTMLTNSKKLG
jgi:hypothetical protein